MILQQLLTFITEAQLKIDALPINNNIPAINENYIKSMIGIWNKIADNVLTKIPYSILLKNSILPKINNVNEILKKDLALIDQTDINYIKTELEFIKKIILDYFDFNEIIKSSFIKNISTYDTRKDNIIVVIYSFLGLSLFIFPSILFLKIYDFTFLASSIPLFLLILMFVFVGTKFMSIAYNKTLLISKIQDESYRITILMNLLLLDNNKDIIASIVNIVKKEEPTKENDEKKLILSEEFMTKLPDIIKAIKEDKN